MKIALIGASGFVGTAVLTEALSRSHMVTGIVRNPDNIKIKDPKLIVLKGDILNEDISKLLVNHDVVVDSFNPGWNDPDIYHDFINGSESIIKATKKAGVKRLIIVGGAGSLENYDGKQLVDSPDFPPEWRQGALALRTVLNILKNEHELEWTFLSPAVLLQPGEKTGKFRIGNNKPLYTNEGISKINVGDLAIALVNEIEEPKFINSRFTVGY